MSNIDKGVVKERNIINCKPFLRWAGGKRWLVKDISRLLAEISFNDYHEPFLGGGSLFFHLQPRLGHISDLNQELVETYLEVRDDVEGIIRELTKFENTEEFYYKIRATEFASSKLKRAARFIFLNQTSFNGIYRVNLNGKYNVPYGFRTKNFQEPENLKKISKVLKNTKINCCDFSKSLNNIKRHDLVFLDPPYTVTHNNNGFIKYNDKLFDLEAQHRLSRYIDKVKQKGAYYILTNAAHKEIKDIFLKNGDKFIEVERASIVGGKNAKRGKYGEYVFTNII